MDGPPCSSLSFVDSFILYVFEQMYRLHVYERNHLDELITVQFVVICAMIIFAMFPKPLRPTVIRFEHKPMTSDASCCICLDDYSVGDKCVELPVCHHVFHDECASLWYSSHHTCPVCRRSIYDYRH